MSADRTAEQRDRYNANKRAKRAANRVERTHCKRGHEYTPENVYINATSGARQCRQCVRYLNAINPRVKVSTPESRQRRNARDRAQRAADPETRRAKDREAWARANPESRKAASRRTYLKHREQRYAESRAWQAAHPELVAKHKRAWMRRNAEQARAASKAWADAHPERRRSTVMNRRARIKQLFVEPVQHGVVYERDAGVCQICSSPIGDEQWHIDHIMPISLGGEHSYANVQLAHARCNQAKGNRVAS